MTEQPETKRPRCVQTVNLYGYELAYPCAEIEVCDPHEQPDNDCDKDPSGCLHHNYLPDATQAALAAENAALRARVAALEAALREPVATVEYVARGPSVVVMEQFVTAPGDMMAVESAEVADAINAAALARAERVIEAAAKGEQP